MDKEGCLAALQSLFDFSVICPEAFILYSHRSIDIADIHFENQQAHSKF